jgi:hypothetical protein
MLIAAIARIAHALGMIVPGVPGDRGATGVSKLWI